MSKLIIRNESSHEDDLAVASVLRVVDKGLISETGATGKQYCFATTFDIPKIVIYVHKHKSGTQTFYVRDDKDRRRG